MLARLWGEELHFIFNSGMDYPVVFILYRIVYVFINLVLSACTSSTPYCAMHRVMIWIRMSASLLHVAGSVLRQTQGLADLKYLCAPYR